MRADLVAERLQDIENGRALHLLLETDERERLNKTYCVGMRWGYEREDLVEIIQVRRRPDYTRVTPRSNTPLSTVLRSPCASHHLPGLC